MRPAATSIRSSRGTTVVADLDSDVPFLLLPFSRPPPSSSLPVVLLLSAPCSASSFSLSPDPRREPTAMSDAQGEAQDRGMPSSYARRERPQTDVFCRCVKGERWRQSKVGADRAPIHVVESPEDAQSIIPWNQRDVAVETVLRRVCVSLGVRVGVGAKLISKKGNCKLQLSRRRRWRRRDIRR